MNNTAIISAWRPAALAVVRLEQSSTETQRHLAWKFLKQHGVKRNNEPDLRPCDTEPPSAA